MELNYLIIRKKNDNITPSIKMECYIESYKRIKKFSNIFKNLLLLKFPILQIVFILDTHNKSNATYNSEQITLSNIIYDIKTDEYEIAFYYNKRLTQYMSINIDIKKFFDKVDKFMFTLYNT